MIEGFWVDEKEKDVDGALITAIDQHKIKIEGIVNAMKAPEPAWTGRTCQIKGFLIIEVSKTESDNKGLPFEYYAIDVKSSHELSNDTESLFYKILSAFGLKDSEDLSQLASLEKLSRVDWPTFFTLPPDHFSETKSGNFQFHHEDLNAQEAEKALLGFILEQTPRRQTLKRAPRPDL